MPRTVETSQATDLINRHNREPTNDFHLRRFDGFGHNTITKQYALILTFPLEELEDEALKLLKNLNIAYLTTCFSFSKVEE